MSNTTDLSIALKAVASRLAGLPTEGLDAELIIHGVNSMKVLRSLLDVMYESEAGRSGGLEWVSGKYNGVEITVHYAPGLLIECAKTSSLVPDELAADKLHAEIAS